MQHDMKATKSDDGAYPTYIFEDSSWRVGLRQVAAKSRCNQEGESIDSAPGCSAEVVENRVCMGNWLAEHYPYINSLVASMIVRLQQVYWQWKGLHCYKAWLLHHLQKICQCYLVPGPEVNDVARATNASWWDWEDQYSFISLDMARVLSKDSWGWLKDKTHWGSTTVHQGTSGHKGPIGEEAHIEEVGQGNRVRLYCSWCLYAMSTLVKCFYMSPYTWTCRRSAGWTWQNTWTV
jgi:hypothetical protein